MATTKQYDQGTLDYFNKKYGGIDNYAKTQNDRYKAASAAGDTALQQKIMQDAGRVGYGIEGTKKGSSGSSSLAKEAAGSNTFNPGKYSALDYTTALGQANQQLDPTYQRAVENVRSNQAKDVLNTSEVASARGGAHSGLAADAQTKVAMNASNQIADLDAQRATEAAAIAQALVQRSEDRTAQQRAQDFNEWLSQQQLGLQRDQFDFTRTADQRDYDRLVGRDQVGDNQWQQNFDYGKSIDQRDYDRLVGRDKVADNQWNQQFEYTQGRDKVADQRWEKEFERIQKQDGIQNALAWAQNSISRQNANTSASSAANSRNNARFGQLMDIWQATGVAPEGIDGVAAGTPYRSSSGSGSSSQGIDSKTSTDNYNTIRTDVNSARSFDEAVRLLQQNRDYLTDSDYAKLYNYVVDQYETE